GGGALVRLPMLPPAAAYVDLHLELPDGPLDVRGTVLRRDEGDLVALGFDWIAHADEERLIGAGLGSLAQLAAQLGFGCGFGSGSALRGAMISSIRPYSSASAAVMKRSRSMSRITWSKSLPLCCAMISAIRRVVAMISCAWISMSAGVPRKPAE